MKIFHSSKIRILIGSLLTAGVLGAGAFSMAFMDHSNSSRSCFVARTSGQDGMPSDSGSLCTEYHLGILHELTQVAPSNLLIQMIILCLLAVAVLIGMAILRTAVNDLSYFRSRLKRLWQDGLLRFYRQIGEWLTLFEKRDPSDTVMRCNFSFGMS